MKAFLYTLLFITTIMCSCNKFETYPVERITSDIIYDSLDKNGTYAEWVVNDIYSYIPSGYNRISNVVLDAATDDAIATDFNHTIEILGQSKLNASNNPDDFWDDGYSVVRKVNIFLANIDVVPRDEDTKNYWKAEVRFIRALGYFELLKRYGGVPLLGDRHYTLNEKITVKRSSFDQVVDYIVSECDAIKDDLRADPIPDNFLGRITNGAALALKSRTLLYAASPLNNPSNQLDKWENAALAAKALIDNGKFSLEANYKGMFLSRKNKEVIFARQSSQAFALEVQNAPIGFKGINISNGYVSPSQNLVDAFPMINGKAINDGTSEFDASNPYANRDPRLGATVFYNGNSWLGRTVELYDGGVDRPLNNANIARQTRTGYYMRKFLGNFESANAYGNVNHNFPIFRYAEILLNYAEASNEINQPDAAYVQLKAIRQRAGIQAGLDGMYGLKAGMSQMELREAIRLERRIELSFEEHRYWDLRRWGIAEDVLNKPIMGVSIIKNSDGTFTYNYKEVSSVTFKQKQYLYPIPFKETIVNGGAVEQNSGW